MSEYEIREMCNSIYEGGYWEPMIDLIQGKDKEIERLNQEIRCLNNCIIEFHSEFCNKQAEINRLNNIINELENRDDILEEYEDWLERQKTRNSEWDNFIMVDGRLGIPISYLLNKLQELKGEDKE